MAAIDIFNQRLIDGGHRILAEGVQDPQDALVIDNRTKNLLVTQGPLNDTKEFMSGLWIIEAQDDAQARELAIEASRACNRKIEVRKFL
jgi:hypothetical protein